MPRQAFIYRILIASPSDMEEERRAIPEVIRDWNIANSLFRGVYLEPVLFETHASPEMGDRPQAIINRQLVQTCDILIGTFWTRLGTPTEKAKSGTVEEIEEFRKAGKPVLLYFSSAVVVLDNVDSIQYKKLLKFREQCQQEGLIFSYMSISNLREQLNKHITATIDSLRDVSPFLP
ncbi:MAG: DUF4062 domain-containing protein [Dehalococcoidales bacterium]|nr:DUF4062 domain-containing protein [Dehalococcoidales bacterium]